jgi:hypothetical protein
MSNLKTYEGFFDFFKKKPVLSEVESEDDKIIQEYIDRLKRIKDISPYDIELEVGAAIKQFDASDCEYQKYSIGFEDTPIRIVKIEILSTQYNRFTPDLKKKLLDDGGVFKKENLLYMCYLMNPRENIYASWQKLEELFNLTKDIYTKDKNARRVNRIKMEINPAADRLDPEIYGDDPDIS